MMVSTIRRALAGTACAALMFTPLFAGAANSTAGAKNLTDTQQQAGAIPLPSLAPLAERVLPAVVNVSVQLTQQAAMKTAAMRARARAAIVAHSRGAAILRLINFFTTSFNSRSLPHSQGKRCWHSAPVLLSIQVVTS